MPINVITERDFTPRTFEEAKAHFEKKAPLTHEEFARLTLEQRAKAFRIATVHNARMVQDARNLLAKAVETGQTFADWREALLARFTGANVPPPAMHRLRLAFFQNTGKAYSDARREVLDDPEITEAFPYRQYITVGNGTAGFRNVRPDHAALHNKIFRWNDPFWDRFTPPWDYGCRCTFVALTAGQAAGSTVWTYRGGSVRPATKPRRHEATKGQEKAFQLKTNPRYSIESGDLDLSALDPDLRAAVEDRLGAGL